MIDKPRARAAIGVCLLALLLGSCIGVSQHPGPEACGGDESATLLRIRTRDGTILDSRSVAFASEQPLLQHGDELLTISQEDGAHLTAWDEQLNKLWSVKVFDSEYVQAVKARGATAIVTSEDSVAAVSLEERTLMWARSFGQGHRLGEPAISKKTVYVPARRDLVALDLATGDETWRVEFESHPVTPLLRGAVITGAARPSHGDKPGPLRALDKQSGEVLWEGPHPGDRTGRPRSPISIGTTIIDKKISLGGGSTILMGLEPRSGTETWTRTFHKRNLWAGIHVVSDYLVLSPREGAFSLISGENGNTEATGRLPRRHHLFDVAHSDAGLLLASRSNQSVDVRRVTKDTTRWMRKLKSSHLPLFGGPIAEGQFLRLINQQQQKNASLALIAADGKVMWTTRMPHALVEQPVHVGGENIVALSSDPAPACL